MPKKLASSDLLAVLSAVGRLPGGGSAEEIGLAMPAKVPHRTMQRRLAGLVAATRLVVQGRGRASRYRLPPIAGQLHAVTQDATAHAQGELIPLSPEGRLILQAVRQPIQHRRPVGYERSFLSAYRPNISHYIPEEMRLRLAGQGSFPQGSELAAGTYARQILGRLMIDLSWNSSRLEGNTYSLLETERLLEMGESADGKNAKEAQMILNHKAAIELLVEQAQGTGFNRYTVLNLHALLADNLLDPGACGRLRAIPVGVAGTAFLPLAVPQQIEECFQQVLDLAAAIDDPFEQSFFAMVHLPYLQPFEDVNKRVSRLAANLPMIRRNLCPLSFVDVPERAYVDGILGVYEQRRVELLRDVFVWAYERSCARYSVLRQSLGEPDAFRLQHRRLISETVGEIVRGHLNKKGATAFTRQRATQAMPEPGRARFLEVVETELMSLHEGNIARHRLRPSEFDAWRLTWR